CQSCDPSGLPHQSPRPPTQTGLRGAGVRLASVRAAGEPRPEELSAVRAFVAMLKHGSQARASGSALARAYTKLRHLHGWPALAPNTFGKLLKIAVQEAAGRKLKSNLQIYEGVRIPVAWGMKTAA